MILNTNAKVVSEHLYNDDELRQIKLTKDEIPGEFVEFNLNLADVLHYYKTFDVYVVVITHRGNHYLLKESYKKFNSFYIQMIPQIRTFSFDSEGIKEHTINANNLDKILVHRW
jgi:hypothetical protein